GPLTSGAKGSVIDGRSYAKALDVPAGRSGISLQHIDAGQLVIDHAVTASRGEPTAEGLQVEATSTVEGIAIGTALKIDRLVSRAYALIPATSGDAKGAGSTACRWRSPAAGSWWPTRSRAATRRARPSSRSASPWRRPTSRTCGSTR